MTEEQQDSIYAAYLGICVLQTMCRKAGLALGAQRSKELLVELGTDFPFIPERIALETLRPDKPAAPRPASSEDWTNAPIEKNEQGQGIRRFVDRNHHECYIQQSSLATENCVWLGSVQGRSLMHLTQAHAAALAEVLQRFVKTGDL